MALDWMYRVSRILEALSIDELQGMGEVVKKANAGVRRRGVRATSLGEIAARREDETATSLSIGNFREMRADRAVRAERVA